LGAGADSTLSYIWAEKGFALMERGDLLAAAQSLELSVGLNTRKKPDRPYNLGCVYAKMAAVVASRAEYIRKAVAQLEASLQLATNQAKENTDSKAYYRQKIRTDPDLDGIRGEAEFQKLQEGLPQDG
jgi:hypothetical protein